MKQLTCEMCGSTDMMKQDGVFVCQTCGTKYSVEDAKKMMVEGTVEVQGTVKVDNTDKIKNYLEMAKSAYEADNKKEAESYCNRIIEIEPKHYEAWFLKGKAAGWQSTLGNLRIEEAVQCFSKSIDYAPDEEKENNKKEAAEEVSKLSRALVSLCCNNFVEYPSDSNGQSIMKNVLATQEFALTLLKKCGVEAAEFNSAVATMINSAVCNAWSKITADYRGDDGRPSKYEWETFKDRCFGCIELLKLAINVCDNDDQADVQRYKNLIEITTELVGSCSWTKNYANGVEYWSKEWSLTNEAKEKNIDNIMEYHQKIKEIDPEYIVPERPSAKELSKKKKSGGGCYVATAVYGSYDCPEVWTLRRYRDDTLAKTWYGRAFIHLYYAVSPTIVKWFGNTEWFRKLWKNKLDKMVSGLQSEGVESTPYEDKEW